MLAYSSISPRVQLVKTAAEGGWAGDDQDQIVLDFSAGRRGARNFNVRCVPRLELPEHPPP